MLLALNLFRAKIEPVLLQLLQAGGNLFLLIRVQMGVYAEGSFHLFMSQPFSDQKRAETLLDQQGSVRMPLRYNNDKQKKPLFSRGLSVCRLLFNSFSKLKIDENYKEKRRLFY